MFKKKLEETKVIFFDLDGTLIDTEKIYFKFWKEASKFFGRELSDEEALNMRSRYTESAIEYLNSISNNKLDYLKVKAKRIELMDEYFKNHPIEIKEYALEFLSKLNKENKKIYIVTANAYDKAKDILQKVGFYHLVSEIISAKDVKRGKPFPDVYLKACEIVNESPENVIVFEDSDNGLLSSYNAGCYTVMIEDLTKYNDKMTFVHHHISSYKELL